LYPLTSSTKRQHALCGQLFILIFVVFVSACATAPPMVPVANPPQQLPLEVVVNKERPVIAFVLGSGAARGFAHVGVLNVLDKHGIEADIVVGSSAGSVVAAFYAAGIRNQALVDAAQQLDMTQLTDWVFPNRGIVRGIQLQHYVNQLVRNSTIESLATKFVAVATDLESGELAAFNYGDTGMAVRASSSIPGIVQPTNIAGRDYIDGGLVSQVPVRIARQMGADIVIAVDVSRTPLSTDQLDTTMAVMRQAMLIAMQRISEEEIHEADIIIRPEVGNIGANEFGQRNHVVASGEAAALEKITQIKKLISEKNDKVK